jgi:hypothetical protein
MEQNENNPTKHLIAVGLVALIGLTGLVLMFQGTGTTAQAVRGGISDVTINGCNGDELLLDGRGVEMLKTAGRAKYGPQFSAYTAARINFNGVAYCAKALVVKELLG